MAEILADKYEVITTINKGSYGVVSLVRDIKTDEQYAAKCISKHRPQRSVYTSVATNAPLSERFSGSQGFSAAFTSDAQRLIDGRYEIQVHEVLGEHPSILKLVDHFELDSKLYLILEYCSGGDLYESIRSGSDLFYPRERIRDLMNQLIDVVEYCHARGIYHRDIKPENILISADGRFKLADWGLATSDRQCSDFLVGSRQYMAPECFDPSGPSYDAAKADIWALGICLLNAIFGRNPFKAANQADRLFTDFAASRESLFDIFPSLSQDVFAVLRHCLTIDPSNRSLEEMRRSLAEVKIWTTDEEFDMIGQLPSFEPPAIDVMNITTEADRPPLRVPSAVAMSSSPLEQWDRLMQFTPPVSRAKFRPPRGGRYTYDHVSGSIPEEDETVGSEPALGRSSDHSSDSHDHDESIFCMDDLSQPLSELSSDSPPFALNVLNEKPMPTLTRKIALDFDSSAYARSWADEDEAFSRYQEFKV